MEPIINHPCSPNQTSPGLVSVLLGCHPTLPPRSPPRTVCAQAMRGSPGALDIRGAKLRGRALSDAMRRSASKRGGSEAGRPYDC